MAEQEQGGGIEGLEVGVDIQVEQGCRGHLQWQLIRQPPKQGRQAHRPGFRRSHQRQGKGALRLGGERTPPVRQWHPRGQEVHTCGGGGPVEHPLGKEEDGPPAQE